MKVWRPASVIRIEFRVTFRMVRCLRFPAVGALPATQPSFSEHPEFLLSPTIRFIHFIRATFGAAKASEPVHFSLDNSLA
jgi:hypothetical protein